MSCCILQDVYVEPSVLQKRLYEDFSQSSASREVANIVSAGDTGTTNTAEQAPKAPHVFQVCSLCNALSPACNLHIPLLRCLE